MLQFYLTPNTLNGDPDGYIAISSNSKSVSIEDVYDHMTREGSTITKAEALSNFEEMLEGMIILAKMGYSVNSPLVNVSSAVTGMFKLQEDDFERNLHGIRLSLTPGKRLAEAADEIEPQKISPKHRHPTPVHFYDNSTETRDEIITPHGGARITGDLLKFDEEDEHQGIFFINMDDNTEIRANARMLKNKPKELIFITPQLPDGTYRLEVRSILRGHTASRTGLLPVKLTVTG